MTARHLLLAAAFACAALAAQDERRDNKVLEPIDVMRLSSVSAAWLSPDANVIAFTRNVARPPADPPGPPYHELLVMPAAGGEPRQLLDGKQPARGVAFTQDGVVLTFLRKGEGDAHTEIWGIPVAGGDAVKLTTTPHGVEHYAWRPDGGAIAFTCVDPAPAERAAARARGFKQRVVDEDFDHLGLWIWDRATAESKRVTSGATVFEFAWSPDGTKIAAAIAPRNLTDDSYMFQRLHVVDVASGAATPLVDNPGKLGEFAWSPDSKRVAYVSAADRRDPHAGMLYSVVVGESTPRAHTEGFLGMVHEIAWRENAIVATVSVGVRTELVSIDTETNTRTTLARDDDVAFRSFDQRGDRLVFVGSTAAHPSEVYGFADGALRRLTNSNPWLGEVALGWQEVVRFDASDGVPIEGLLMHPVGFKKEQRYPLVIVVHGGPEAHNSHGWNTNYASPGQVLAGRGYFAWYPNYRASTGYGVAFTKLDHGDPMGGEFRDHVDAIAHLVERGVVDPTRVGIIGGSYGGYTAAWAATAGTQHFAAAVAFVPFADLRTKWYTSDIPWEFYFVHYQEKWPHDQTEFLASRSPLTYAAQCKTPLLLIGGDADPRVHPSQPHMLYRAVKTATSTPVRYVQYPGEGHGNRVNTNQFDFLVRSLAWLEHYLREGDHRADAPPPVDVDYSTWK